MRFSPLLTIGAALVAVIVVGTGAALVLQPSRHVLDGAEFSLTHLTADSGAVLIRYTLNRNATLTISFQRKSDGTQYFFRKDEARAASTYQVYFNGIVDGYLLPGEHIDGTVEARLIPNGDYTWYISAKADSGQSVAATGSLTINFADTTLPLIQDFSVTPTIFTPNQDGIDDRIGVNAYLAKKSTLTVFLQSAQGTVYYVPERVEDRQVGEAGPHVFDYDGGVDNNVTPPPDGDYTLVALAEDAAGQRVRRTSQLTIKDSGLPQAEIQPQTTGSTVRYMAQPFNAQGVKPPDGVGSLQSSITVKQGDMLVFRLTVHNYGPTPIRTLGPWPGTVYRDDQTDAVYTNLEKVSRSGAWRVGVQCETSETTLPWRWAIGAPDELTTVTDTKGDTFYYLMPGQSATVWGAVQMNRIIKTRNPQNCWVSLIHEDVIIPSSQQFVGPIRMELVPTP